MGLLSTIGAAAGTVIAPGVGTAVGGMLGGALEGGGQGEQGPGMQAPQYDTGTGFEYAQYLPGGSGMGGSGGYQPTFGQPSGGQQVNPYQNQLAAEVGKGIGGIFAGGQSKAPLLAPGYAMGGYPNLGRPTMLTDMQTGKPVGVMNENPKTAPEAIVPTFGDPGKFEYVNMKNGKPQTDMGLKYFQLGGIPNVGMDEQGQPTSFGGQSQMGLQEPMPQPQELQAQAVEENQVLERVKPYTYSVFREGEKRGDEGVGDFEEPGVVRAEPKKDLKGGKEGIFGDIAHEFLGKDFNMGDVVRGVARGVSYYWDSRRARYGLGKSGLTQFLDWNEATQGQKRIEDLYAEQTKAEERLGKEKELTKRQKNKLQHGYEFKEETSPEGEMYHIMVDKETGQSHRVARSGVKDMGKTLSSNVDGIPHVFVYDPGHPESEKTGKRQGYRDMGVDPDVYAEAQKTKRKRIGEGAATSRQKMRLSYSGKKETQKFWDDWFESSEEVTVEDGMEKRKTKLAPFDDQTKSTDQVVRETMARMKEKPPDNPEAVQDRMIAGINERFIRGAEKDKRYSDLLDKAEKLKSKRDKLKDRIDDGKAKFPDNARRNLEKLDTELSDYQERLVQRNNELKEKFLSENPYTEQVLGDLGS